MADTQMLADHKIEAVWIPFQGKQLPGWLHLPYGYQGGRLPAVVLIPGMDSFKEGAVASMATVGSTAASRYSPSKDPGNMSARSWAST